jgi:hypothetical protein
LSNSGLLRVSEMKFKKKQFVKTTLKMKDNHTWKAPAGYKIVVLDRGVVSFNIPVEWVVAKTEPNFEMNDKAPPDDDARVSVSFWRTPPGIDWSGLPLLPLLADATKESRANDILDQGEIIRSPRSDIELVWREQRFVDPVEKREAYTRVAVARGFDVQALITSDFWVSDQERLVPIWAEILNSLQLGRYIEDPTKGIPLH